MTWAVPISASDKVERREYKYLIDEATAHRVRMAVRPFCELDEHAARTRDHQYTIDSIYLDTPDFALFRANGRELVDRFKLRVRGYPPHIGGDVFFEVKRRQGDVISKTRGRVPQAQWAQLLADPAAKIPDSIRDPDRAAVERFLALTHTYQARPVTVVRYEREAWVSQIDVYARVTFDRRIRSQARAAPSLQVQPRGWRFMDNAAMQRMGAAMTVLELKFTTAVPRWMFHIVQQFDLIRGAFSKYGTSVLAWHNGAPEAVRRPRRYRS